MKCNDEELEILEAIDNDKVKSVLFDNEDIKAHAQKTATYLNQKSYLQYKYRLSKDLKKG